MPAPNLIVLVTTPVFKYKQDNGWSFAVMTKSQFTSSELLAAEQFRPAGQLNVRGLIDGNISTDKGVVVSSELYTPSYEWWANNSSFPGQIFHKDRTLTISPGIHWRQDSFSLDLYYAYVLSRPVDDFLNQTAFNTKRSSRLHFKVQAWY